MSAAGFTTDMNATNAFLEIAAEGGLFSFIGLLSVLIFVARKRNNETLIKPFKLAFYITSIALLIESSYLRPYVWALYGIIIGLNSSRPEAGISFMRRTETNA